MDSAAQTSYLCALAEQPMLDEFLLKGRSACRRHAADSLMGMRYTLPNLRRLGLKAPFVSYMPYGNHDDARGDFGNWVRYDPRSLPHNDDEVNVIRVDGEEMIRRLESMDDRVPVHRHAEESAPISPYNDPSNLVHKIFDILPLSLEELQIAFSVLCDPPEIQFGDFMWRHIGLLGRRAMPRVSTQCILDQAGLAGIRPSTALFNLLERVAGITAHFNRYLPRLGRI